MQLASVPRPKHLQQLFLVIVLFLRFLRGPETSWTLLIHLCSWCYAIYERKISLIFKRWAGLILEMYPPWRLRNLNRWGSRPRREHLAQIDSWSSVSFTYQQQSSEVFLAVPSWQPGLYTQTQLTSCLPPFQGAAGLLDGNMDVQFRSYPDKDYQTPLHWDLGQRCW